MFVWCEHNHKLRGITRPRFHSYHMRIQFQVIVAIILQYEYTWSPADLFRLEWAYLRSDHFIPSRKFHLVFIECNMGGRYLLISYSCDNLQKVISWCTTVVGGLSLSSSLALSHSYSADLLLNYLLKDISACFFLFFSFLATQTWLLMNVLLVTARKKMFYRFDIFVTCGIRLQDTLDINPNYRSPAC